MIASQESKIRPDSRGSKVTTNSTASSILNIVKPPQSYDEFIQMEGLKEWPQRLTSELPLSFEKEIIAAFGSQLDIIKILEEAAFVDMTSLDKIEESLTELTASLTIYSSQILNEETPVIQKLLTNDAEEPNEVKANRLQNKNDLFDLKQRSIEFCVFPGFNANELTELPSSLETPQILHRISKAQHVMPGFHKFWKKIFLSEASLAFVQDSFWWIFLDYFKKRTNYSAEKSSLFDRLCDSFTALFFSIHPESKDAFLQLYPEAIAQALYSIFHEAFTESRNLIDNDPFKQYVVNIIFEWITGSHPLPESFRFWNYDIIEASLMPVQADTADSVQKSLAESVMQAVIAMNDPTKVKLELDSFEKAIKQLGNKPIATVSFANNNQLKKKNVIPPIKNGITNDESHPIGAGPTLSRVYFDVYGNSPLVAHYLSLHRGVAPVMAKYKPHVPTDNQQIDSDVIERKSKLTRTELSKRPEEGRQTYRQFIEQEQQNSKAKHDDFDKISQETKQVLADINRRKTLINRKIRKLEDELSNSKSSLEIKLFTASIMEDINEI